MILNYKVFGDENTDVLMILHGLFGMLDNWTTLAKKFAKKYKVYAIDLRNHGKSPHSDVMSYESMSEDLKEFMEAEGIYTANIIGHSMGGKALMTFGNMYPEHIERMIVVDIAPKAYEPKHNEIIEALTKLPLNKMSTRDEAEYWLSQRIEQASVRLFLLKNLLRTKNGFQWKMNLPVIIKFYQEIIGSINIDNGFERPILMVYGGSSDYLNEDDIEELDLVYDNVKFEQVEGTGHWVHAEKPNEFFELVSNFLESELY
ncbi:MAG: alpha/beta fold hydrolase [Bacteroidia bacterium]